MDIDDLTARYTAAWNSGDPAQVASFFAPGGSIVINVDGISTGRDEIAEMAKGFHTAVPDLELTRDGFRSAGAHVLSMWTFTGHDADTGNRLSVSGWEEWDLNDAGQVQASRGWFDAQDYARQVAGD
ncbi:MAG: SgcJ/EcaC family oxidoreductase [Rhodobacteraceae bacterium]|nr:SgcJ/EcaC family oxidoreductase [Paracoccaceae bacterium]